MTGAAHSTLGASGAYRWMACPGSVALSEGIPRRDTAFSKEGTAAHALAETVIQGNRNAHSYIGEYFEGIKVTEEMAQAVQVYADYVKGRKDENGTLMLEHRFSLDKLNPPVPMFGTADAIIYQPKYKRLLVIDYKHGAGEVVHVTGNKQLRYYALGALLTLDKPNIETIEIVIVQPRAPHSDGPIRSETVTVTEIMDFSIDLMEAAAETTKANAPLSSGKHCRFCPAQPKCPELHREAKLVAKQEFEAQPLPKPELLSPAQVQFILSKADTIEAWLTSLRDYAVEEIKAGRDVPGFKLVATRANRYWTDHEQVIEWAKEKGIHEDELFDKKLKSPAALEKVVGKKELPTELVSSVSKNVTLVPVDDKRPALTFSASQEFSALPES